MFPTPPMSSSGARVSARPGDPFLNLLRPVYFARWIPAFAGMTVGF